MKKRILSIALALCMMLTLVPTMAFASDPTYVVAGSSELCERNWEGSPDGNEGNVMTANGDGTYIKVYTNVAVKNGYTFKVVENFNDGTQTWYGADGNYNVTFNVVSVCDVTITFDSATHEITVTGTGVEFSTDLVVDSVTVVGNGDPEDPCWLGVQWDPGAYANQMTEIEPKVYEITYTKLEKYEPYYNTKINNYEFKFAINSSWNDSFGGTYSASGVESEATYNGSNITFTAPYELTDVTIRLDLSGFDFATKSGATFTVTLVETHDHDFTGDWDYDDTYHWHNCQNGDCKEIQDQAKHSGGTATCTSKAFCEFCDAEYGDLDSGNHSLSFVPAKDATATETGNTEYYVCEDCQHLFEDANGVTEIADKDSVVIPPSRRAGRSRSDRPDRSFRG
ncbi:MAG: hypothetical protein ACI4IM_05405 [Acutalibacteraceae bacterium]